MSRVVGREVSREEREAVVLFRAGGVLEDSLLAMALDLLGELRRGLQNQPGIKPKVLGRIVRREVRRTKRTSRRLLSVLDRGLRRP
jgi:hypothetical protein